MAGHTTKCSEDAKVQGQVKWFNNTRGFGFIGHDDGPDVFVHYTGIIGEGYKTLHEGDAVEFEIVQSPKGRPQAANVTRRTLNSTPQNQVATDTKEPYVPPPLTTDVPLAQNDSERTHKRGQVTPAYTTVVDKTRMFVDVSKSFCDLLGYRRAELLGTRYDHLTAPNTADIPATSNLFSKLGYMHGLWVLLHRTGYRILIRYES